MNEWGEACCMFLFKSLFLLHVCARGWLYGDGVWDLQIQIRYKQVRSATQMASIAAHTIPKTWYRGPFPHPPLGPLPLLYPSGDNPCRFEPVPMG